MAVFLASLASLLTAVDVLPELAPLGAGLKGVTLGVSAVLAIVAYVLGLLDGLREDH